MLLFLSNITVFYLLAFMATLLVGTLHVFKTGRTLAVNKKVESVL